jgi:hypothetical protein
MIRRDTICEIRNGNSSLPRYESGYGGGFLTPPPSVSYRFFPIGGYGDTPPSERQPLHSPGALPGPHRPPATGQVLGIAPPRPSRAFPVSVVGYRTSRASRDEKLLRRADTRCISRTQRDTKSPVPTARFPDCSPPPRRAMVPPQSAVIYGSVPNERAGTTPRRAQ